MGEAASPPCLRAALAEPLEQQRMRTDRWGWSTLRPPVLCIASARDDPG